MAGPDTSERTNPASFFIADWRVDPASLRISRGPRTVKLEPKAMAVLLHLADRPGEVFSREDLESTVWAGTVVGYDALSNAIIKLRKAFGDKARNPHIIETISKTGYRLIAEVNRGGAGSEDTPERLPRTLAAILYADVAGYSRLTGADEDATHRRLSECLDLFETVVTAHRGQITHYAGDAVLAIFGAAVDAVAAAVELQRNLATGNAGLPEERRVEFRIGVNLGDVIEDRGDVYGDGVNVAARLEQLAEPGGIAVSDAIRTAVGSKLQVQFQFFGEQRVKNIVEPVRTYRVVDFDQPPGPGIQAAENPELPDRPSIAVLAFDNMSGDPEQEYFSDGVAEDIITDLSKIAGLFVIARNSAFAYKGRPINLQDVSRELGVRYVLEGSVRKAADRLRISAQLIDGATGGHVWAERYDLGLTDIFEVQDEVRQAIVTALAPTLNVPERHFGRRETQSDDAYDWFLRGREQDQRDNREANEQARAMLSKALELDPTFSLACSHLSRNLSVCFINRWSESVTLESAVEMARRAIELDATNPHAHFALGAAAVWMRRHDLALREAERAIAIEPNFAEGHAVLGMIQTYSGQSQSAVTSLQTAMRLDPHYRDAYLHLIAQAYFHCQQYQAAANALRRRLIRKPDSDTSRVLLAATCGHLGDLATSRAEWAAALRINPDYSLAHKREILPYKNPQDFDQIVAGLSQAELP